MSTVEELEAEIEKLRNEHKEFKRSIIKTARNYAEEHSLCEVVDQALREVPGLVESEKITLEIKVPFTLTTEMDPTRVEGDEDPAVALARKLAPYIEISINEEDAVEHIMELGRMTISPEAERLHGDILLEFKEIEVNGQTVSTCGRAGDRWNTPRGYVPRFSSWDGRVYHFFLDDPTTYVTSLCNDHGGYLHSLPTTSVRSEERVCVRCTRKAEGLRR